MKIQYYRQLDGIRAVAALMVMYMHFVVAFKSDSAIYQAIAKYASFGQTGVSIFFVLSGFLITRILMATKGSARFFSDFYIRRALRIFPLYYLFLFLFYFLVPLLQNIPIAPAGKQFYAWVYLQNFAMTFNWDAVVPSHYWSLAVEEHFYFLWPCLVYFFNKKGIKIAIAGILIIAFICRLVLINKGFEVFYFTFTRMDELAMGALLAVWELEGKLKGNAKKFIVGLVLVLLPAIVLWVKVTGQAMVVVQVVKYNLLSLSCFCLVGYVIALQGTSWVSRILTSRFFQFSGKISYGLYVYHPLCFFLIQSYFKPTIPVPVFFMISFGITYLVAAVSFYLFEAKFIALKKYFEHDRLSSRLPTSKPATISSETNN